MTTSTLKNPLVTRKVFADELAVSLPTLWRYANNGTVPKPIRIGNRVGWPRSVVDAWKINQGWPATEQVEG